MRRTRLLNVLLAILLVIGLLARSTAIALSSTTVKLWIGNASMSINGVQQLIDVQGTKPVIVAGRTLVPIRAVIEAFDGSVAWDATESKVTVTLGKDSLNLWIGKSQAILNYIPLTIDAANPAVVPIITNGRTMLPLRFVAESLGIDVQYDAASRMITLTYSIKEIITPPVTYTVTVTTVGNGTVTLVPAGGTYNYGTVATLTATPAAGYMFSGWTGDMMGMENPLTITMTVNKTITATFAQSFTLNVAASPSGGGTVTRNPDQLTYMAGSGVQLMAFPASGYVFSGWFGDVSGMSNPIVVSMTGNKNVSASFMALPNEYSLVVATSPLAGGTISKTPDQARYTSGSVVQLTATPAAGYTFTGWSGDLSGATNPTTITMDAAKAVTATFAIPVIPTITSKDGLIQFLTTNFGECDTSLGPTRFTFEIYENTSISFPYDYWIKVRFESKFFYDLQYSNTITTEMNHVVCAELKQYQEKLARAAIAAMPSKKLYGCYYDWFYRYPTLQLDIVSWHYYSWVNYSPNIAITNYEEAKITGFSWWSLNDDKLER